MKNLCILTLGSFSLVEFVNEMFISTECAYMPVRRTIPNEQLVSAKAETKIQILKYEEDQVLIVELGAAKRA